MSYFFDFSRNILDRSTIFMDLLYAFVQDENYPQWEYKWTEKIRSIRCQLFVSDIFEIWIDTGRKLNGHY